MYNGNTTYQSSVPTPTATVIEPHGPNDADGSYPSLHSREPRHSKFSKFFRKPKKNAKQQDLNKMAHDRGIPSEHFSPESSQSSPNLSGSPFSQISDQTQYWEKEAESLAFYDPANSPSAVQNSDNSKLHLKLALFSNIGSPRSVSEASTNSTYPSSSEPLIKSTLNPQPPPATEQALAMTFSKSVDERLQHAIDLHEAGDLAESAALLQDLADPDSINHPLAQVLCGLCYRHGWGVSADQDRAFRYLRLAAGNSALMDQISSTASNIKPNPKNKSKTGLARGELVLSIFELGNCFRYGWGTAQDPVLAKHYYETAARLGDVDAMMETAWCYMNGFGVKSKDKYAAAHYFRMAERAGKVEMGNSWIWKDKYNEK